MSAKSTAAEVGVKLVLDSNARAEAQHVKDGLRRIDHQAQKTASGWRSKVGGVAKGAGAFAMSAVTTMVSAYAAAASAIVGLGIHSAEAFMESEKQVREIASSLTLIDQKGNTFEALTGYADDLKNELEDVAIQAGVTDDAMVAAFNDIIERGNKTVDQTKELAEQMAYAGRALPGGMAALSGGFEQIQMGMIRAKNPLVQLISATGTLKGSAKEVAKEMQKMSVDEQMKLAEKAIGSMAAKMKNAPMTIEQMKTSMSVAVGNLFEEIGKPIVGALGPVVSHVRDLLMGEQGGLLAGAKTFGEGIAKVLALANPIIDGLVGAFRESWDDIQKAFDAFYGPAKDLFSYLYDNKEAFGNTIKDVAKVLITAFTYVVRAVGFIKDTVMGIVGAAASIIPGYSKLKAEENQAEQSKQLRAAVMGTAVTAEGKAGSLSNKDFDERRAKFIKAGEEGGLNSADSAKQFDQAYRRAMDDHMATVKQVGAAQNALIDGDAKRFAAAFNAAAKAGDQSAMEYAAKFLDNNTLLANVLAKEGPAIFEGGYDKLFAALRNTGQARIADYLKGASKPDLGKVTNVQNFNGGIQIKQDFRDQDPDRIVTIMRDDLARAGTSRIQSPFAAPFGF